jgi:hypothetical protein
VYVRSYFRVFAIYSFCCNAEYLSHFHSCTSKSIQLVFIRKRFVACESREVCFV